MIFKDGVVTAGVIPQIWFAVGVADCWRRFQGFGQATVCAMRDGAHMKGSLHYDGRAVDLRTHDMSPDEAERFAAVMKQQLYPYGFDVVHEHGTEHLHIEYDPKPGRVFPAPHIPPASTATASA
jgi:hypothetical protein